jgi:ribonuclease HI
MSAKKQKYYVVWDGNNPGIYDSWAECQLQIKGYPGAKYKSFKTKAEATQAFRDGFGSHIGTKKTKSKSAKIIAKSNPDIIQHSLSVDAACSGSPGILEYRGVWTDTSQQVFHVGPFPYGTNNVGEFLALVHGLSLLQKKNMPDMPIYSDSRTAMAWVRNKHVKTTLVKNETTKQLYQLVERALKWLENSTFKNPILKWQTDKWGEIPADFGRK